jgi:hypothetical protein
MADRKMTEDMGGEIASFIQAWKGKTIRCFGVCKKDKVMDKFVGYSHSSGIADKDGNKWWVYFECPKCRYGHSFAKMDFFMRKTKWEHEDEKK